ncbi:DUF2207 domain-containing protein [Algoriphagus halophytocola]|uniref:DUF2207 domain-containing protein n=1 Tax=Algoriphagus halophytocola TaxID=2991499 RepID=A0ABY6MKB5_9BACT|nr:DUF2207 domain-containing protein [Algoriphagus sp. TR-M5]UZD22644.1 DUF2207 domain-containing protein [Algoriphagus sp. TR-M5]
MKNLYFLLFACLFTLKTQAQGFTVNSYAVEIHISPEGYFDVKESYDLTFEEPKRGIFRDIQTHYDIRNEHGEMEERIIQIKDVKVPGYKFDVTSLFKQKIGGNARIKIGDEDIYLEGPQHYEIRYRVENAFLHEEQAIHFYWNIKTENWIAPFEKINFQIHLPEGINLTAEQYFLYSGQKGNTEPSQDFLSRFSNGIYSGQSKTGVISTSGEAVTVLLKLPLGSIQDHKPFWPFWTAYGWTILLAGLFYGFYRIWKKHGKDDPVTTTTSYYPPKDMDPAMVGFLIDDSGDNADLISLLPYWASRGFIRIEEIDKKGWFAKDDTRLIKLKELPPESESYEKKLYHGLFSKHGTDNEVLVSSLKEKFYKTLAEAHSDLKKAAQAYYVENSRKIKNYTIIGLILLVFLLCPGFLYFWGVLAAIATLVSLIFLLIMSQFMIKKNPLGTELLSELKGFKQFIKVAEENKLRMLLQEDPGYFESTMSYALAFGMFDKWAKKFDGLNLQPPAWYTSTSGRVMGMNHFSKSFNNSIKSTQSTMVSSPSSSGGSGGGGSSGGGFGGGGGGSW